MKQNDARTAEVAVARLAQRLGADPRLQAEVVRARREFFGGDVPSGPTLRGAADTAEHRFAEWFALERESETLGVVPIELPYFADDAGELADSVCGVFLVLSVAAVGVEARDLQDDTLFDLAVPLESLRTGDLVVGRLFSVASARWTPSTAAAVFRPGADLAEAFRRDVQRVDLGRRLQQIELEHLLLRRPGQTRSPTAAAVPTVPLEHLEAQLEKLLQAGGGDITAASVSQELAASPRLGPAMGPLLDRLAFETTVDLDQGRRLMLEIWNAYHGTAEAAGPRASAVSDDPSSAPPGETLGERLVRTLDEGLRGKRDVDELFVDLERLAGLEPGASDEGDNPFDDEPYEPHGDEEYDANEQASGEPETEAAGDLGPLIQEYLWETEREQDPGAAPLLLWVQLQANAPLPHSDLEFVTGTDLMRLLLHVFLGAAPSERAASVRAAFAELRGFYEWAASTQEFEPTAVLQECRGPLLDQVDRLQAAGLSLSTAAVPTTRPGILQIEDIGPAGFGVRDDDGGHHWLTAGAAALASLRQGDLVLGALAPNEAGAARGRRFEGFVVVLPQDARALME